MSRDRLTWWAYGVIASFAFLLNGFGPVLDDLRDQHDLSRTVAGLHSTGLAVGMLVAGAIGERLRLALGWTRYFWAAWGALAAGVVLLGIGGALAVTLTAAVIIGAGGTLLLVMAPAVLSQHHGDAAGPAVAEAHGTASLVGVLAPLTVAASLALLDAWLPALLLVTVVVLPLLGRAAPPLADPAPAGDDPAARPAPLPAAYWSWWTALLFGVAAEFAVLLWAADDARERLELSTAAASVAPAAFLLGMGSARWAGARLLLRHAPATVFARAAVFAVAAFLVYRATDVAAVAFLGLSGVGLGVGLLFPTSLTAAMRSAPGAASQASMRSALASGLAVGLGPLSLGALADATSIERASWIVLLFLAAAIASALASRRTVFAPVRAAAARSPDSGP